MKQKDLKIIAQLRKNARMQLTDMSKKIRIPISTIFDRIKTNEKGVITRYTSLLDFTKMGYNARAQIVFKIDKNERENFRDFLLKSEPINSVYKINNGYDYMVEGIFKQIIDMELFIEDLESKFKIEDKKVFFVIEDIKKESFMSDSDLLFEDFPKMTDKSL